MKYVIEEELGNALIAYLKKRPWDEVNGLITGLAHAQPLPEEEPEPDDNIKIMSNKK